MTFANALLPAGFLASAQVHVALEVGGVAAVVSAVAGVFTVLRGQSFAGHALTDASATGGSGLALVGANPLLGFLAGALAAAFAMQAVGLQRARSRDLATGVVLGASIGLASLFLYLDTTRTATAGLTQQILFGSIFTTTSSTVAVTAGTGVATLALFAAGYRPLLLAAVHPDLAAAAGVPVRAVEIGFLAGLAAAVGLSALAIGAILSTALLVAPAATALRLTRRFGHAVAVAAALGVAATWLGVLLAYGSYDWLPGHRALPVSFCIVAVLFGLYGAAGLATARR